MRSRWSPHQHVEHHHRRGDVARQSRRTPCRQLRRGWSACPAGWRSPCRSTRDPGSASRTSIVRSRSQRNCLRRGGRCRRPQGPRGRWPARAPKSSPTMPSGRGIPPARSTMALESVWLFTSRTCPGSGPSSMRARPRRRWRGWPPPDARRPRPRERPAPRADRAPADAGGCRASSSVSPRRTSSSGSMTFCCGATARVTSIVSASIGSVCSTITTASAPGGHHAAGEDARRLPGPHGDLRRRTHLDRADDGQQRRRRIGRAERRRPRRPRSHPWSIAGSRAGRRRRRSRRRARGRGRRPGARAPWRPPGTRGRRTRASSRSTTLKNSFMGRDCAPTRPAPQGRSRTVDLVPPGDGPPDSL